MKRLKQENKNKILKLKIYKIEDQKFKKRNNKFKNII